MTPIACGERNAQSITHVFSSGFSVAKKHSTDNVAWHRFLCSPTSRLPDFLTPCQLVVALLLMPCSGFHPTFPVAPSVCVLVTAFPRVFQSLLVFLKAPSTVPSFLFFWYLLFPNKPQPMVLLLTSILTTQMVQSPSNCSLRLTTLINGLPFQTLVTGLVAPMDGSSINMSSSTFPRVSSSMPSLLIRPINSPFYLWI
jgi:hypothetical protein